MDVDKRIKGMDKRKRNYRTKILCKSCRKIINSDYKKKHIESTHKGDQKVEFACLDDPKQMKLSFSKVPQNLDPSPTPTIPALLKPDSEKSNHAESTKDLEAISQTGEYHVFQHPLVEEPANGITSFEEGTSVVSELAPSSSYSQQCHYAESECETVMDNAVVEFPIDQPYQPILKSYKPISYNDENATRDFNPKLYESFPWLSFNPHSKSFECFPCRKFNVSEKLFTFSNWRKPDKLGKHAKGSPHCAAMEKWMNFTVNRNKQTSVLLQLQTHHQQEIKRNRKYLSVIIETLIFTAQQNIPQRNSTEDRTDLGTASDVNRGNFLELLHLRCRDLPWLSFKLNENLKKHSQWLSPEIQNEIFDIAATLVRKAICKNVADAEVFSLIMMKRQT